LAIGVDTSYHKSFIIVYIKQGKTLIAYYVAKIDLKLGNKQMAIIHNSNNNSDFIPHTHIHTVITITTRKKYGSAVSLFIKLNFL